MDKHRLDNLFVTFNKIFFVSMNVVLLKERKLIIEFIHSSYFKFSFLAVLSFNQPNFSSTPIWNSNAITFADQSIVGEFPQSIFINTNNTIYIPHRENSTILVCHENSSNPIKITSGNFSQTFSLFVTSIGDIYIDDGAVNGRVQKWISQNNTWITVMNVNSSCESLFVDINDDLYCSM